MEDINGSKIFQIKDAIDSVPFNLYDHETISLTIYKLTATVREKVFNYMSKQ